MNDLGAAGGTGFLTTAELAGRRDFPLGSAIVSPSRRIVSGPGGTAEVEPRVMQVLVVLADAIGSVVTRQTLFDRCWGSADVGDDSLNRAVGGVRRVAADIGAESFAVETIPRTGYRLSVAGATADEGPLGDQSSAGASSFTRRLAIGSGVAAAVGGAAWWASQPRADPRFAALMARGDEAMRNGAYYDPAVISLYEEAIRLDPKSAKAWGLLAFFRSNGLEGAPPADSGRIVRAAEDAARRALSIDPKEPNALTAMVILQGHMLDWAARDQQLRSLLAIDGTNIPALRELMTLVQAAGLTRESRGWNENILKLAPLSRPHLVTRSMKLWLLGRVADADKVIDHVRGLWPDYDFGFDVRLMLFALTGRERAATALMDGAPGLVRPVSGPLWRVAIKALETRSPNDVELARTRCLKLSKEQPKVANIAIMILGALGLADAAFEVANGFLLGRGPQVSNNQTDNPVNNFNRRNTPWLFSPPLAGMRADPRFLKLCDEFGLSAYWRARGVQPDYLRS